MSSVSLPITTDLLFHEGFDAACAPWGVAGGFTTRVLGSMSAGSTAEEQRSYLRRWDVVGQALDQRRSNHGHGAGHTRAVIVQQVHKDRVLHATKPSGILDLAEADALMGDRPGLLLGIRVADCVPVLLASERGVAAVHAGWRGVQANIVAKTVHRMRTVFGSQRVVALIGPHISDAHFEVGEEVLEQLVRSGLPSSIATGRSSRQRPMVSLLAAVSLQLNQVAVDEVHHIDRCTVSEPELYSYRRDQGAPGRLAGVIACGG